MDAKQAIILARKHVADNQIAESSARLCLADAISLYDDGDLDRATRRALSSLMHSVGIFHKDYQRVLSAVEPSVCR